MLGPRSHSPETELGWGVVVGVGSVLGGERCRGEGVENTCFSLAGVAQWTEHQT